MVDDKDVYHTRGLVLHVLNYELLHTHNILKVYRPWGYVFGQLLQNGPVLPENIFYM